jgi:hypothetical protein
LEIFPVFGRGGIYFLIQMGGAMAPLLLT